MVSAMTGNYYRLPTEAEWNMLESGSQLLIIMVTILKTDEYAGMNQTVMESIKGWKKKPNEWGIHDMHGNVAEWTLINITQVILQSY